MKHSITIHTPLGKMIALGDNSYIYSLTFSDNNSTHNKSTEALDFLRQELDLYFSKKLKIFKSKLSPQGTIFQESVWKYLQTVPYGTTTNYQAIASKMNQPKSYRAVANANAQNTILILIPCHRIIRKNGDISGFAAGVERKEFLLNHEKNL